MALGRIGLTQTITSINENSNEAKFCKLYYDVVRLLLLELMPWNFAQNRTVLALHGDQTIWTEFQYAYVFPVTAVRANRIVVDGVQWETAYQKIPFKVVSDNNGGKLILTDQQNAYLDYNADITNENAFTAHFVEAFVTQLGARLASALRVDGNRASSIFNQAQLFINAAVAQNIGHGREAVHTTSSIADARY